MGIGDTVKATATTETTTETTATALPQLSVGDVGETDVPAGRTWTLTESLSNEGIVLATRVKLNLGNLDDEGKPLDTSLLRLEWVKEDLPEVVLKAIDDYHEYLEIISDTSIKEEGWPDIRNSGPFMAQLEEILEGDTRDLKKRRDRLEELGFKLRGRKGVAKQAPIPSFKCDLNIGVEWEVVKSSNGMFLKATDFFIILHSEPTEEEVKEAGGFDEAVGKQIDNAYENANWRIVSTDILNAGRKGAKAKFRK